MVRAFRANETLNLGGEDYTLAIDIATIDAIEDDFDSSFDELLKKVGSGSVRMGKMARLLRGLLLANHPAITLDEVGGLVFKHGAAITGGLERLFVKAWPQAEAKGENPPKARRGTGGNSSSNGARKA